MTLLKVVVGCGWLLAAAGCGSSSDEAGAGDGEPGSQEPDGPDGSGEPVATPMGVDSTPGTTVPGIPAAPGAEPTDPPAGDYGTRAPLLESNSEMAVAELDGKIYVLGGYPSSRVVADTVQVYDPLTGSWTLSEPLPLALHHPVAIGVNGKLYSLGGQLATAAGTDSNEATNRALAYDPVAGGPWLDVAPMPIARGAGAAAAIDDRIYVVGGRPPAGNAFAVYDISDDAWTLLPDVPQAFPERNHLTATAIGGMVYVAGGRYNGGGFSSPSTSSLDRFNVEEGIWEELAPMPRPRGGVNGVAAFGCFFVWGGEGANTGEPNDVFPDHDVYDPESDSWTSLAALPTPIHGVTGAAFVDGLIYMPGGGTAQGGSSGSTIFQVYRPAMRCE
jgi:N-acetylneuraminic acid mutarotase